jgi:positive regulator of sigma E activity
MLRRLGSALILIGLVVMVVYWVSSTIGQGDPITLLGGAVCSLAGLWLRRRAAAQVAAESGRFRTLRKLITPVDVDDEDSDN